MASTATPTPPGAALDPSPRSTSMEAPKLESQPAVEDTPAAPPPPAYKQLALLDRFLALWILLAMVVGVLLGNFVPHVGEKLQEGTFVGVAVPIGECLVNLSMCGQFVVAFVRRWLTRTFVGGY